MRAADIASDRAVIASASPGPWTVKSEWTSEHSGADVVYGATGQLVCQCDEHDGGYCGGQRNVDFIVAARTRWPAALDRVEELERACEVSDECHAENLAYIDRLRTALADMTAARDEACTWAEELVADARGEAQEAADELLAVLRAVGAKP